MDIVHYEGDPYVKELKLTKTVSSIMIQQWMRTVSGDWHWHYKFVHHVLQSELLRELQ